MMKKVLAFLLMTAMLMSTFAFVVMADDEDDKPAVLAHWKLQNNPAYFSGNIDTDELTFVDLSGNGNDLVVGIEGNGSQLDIFSWDNGVNLEDLSSTDTKTALKIDNTWAKAQSVDPYTDEETTFSSAYVSGKYLETVSGAPLNAITGVDGWTVEVVFKVSPEWNVYYNRYTGIVSHQGMVDSQNEPSFSMALGEFDTNGNADGSLGTTGATRLQYIHVNGMQAKVNTEFVGDIYADQWIHYMVVSDGAYTELYCNGELIAQHIQDNDIYIKDASFGWEIGVGRKTPKDGLTTPNPAHPEGVIRRLFCGTISEIRFTDGVIGVEDSLLFAKDEPETEPATEPATEAATLAETSETTAETTVESTVEVNTQAQSDASTSAPEAEPQGCQSALALGILPLALAAASMCFLKKKKEE